MLQTESKVDVPDYWGDARYDPNYTWDLANNPRYGDEESWIASSPDGYKEANIMDASVIADQRARYPPGSTFDLLPQGGVDDSKIGFSMSSGS